MKDIGRALWLEERRKGIGGTDAAAILGLSRWSTPLQVWLQKFDQAPPRVETEAMWWGLNVEPLIARRFQQVTNLDVWKPQNFIKHPQHECSIGSVDFLLSQRQAGLECKQSRSADDWGEPWSDEIPAGYVIQCQHYMALTGFGSWYVAVLFAGMDFQVYEVHADGELQDFIVERCSQWWHRHVVGKERPEMDGNPETARWLAHRFPREAQSMAQAPVEAHQLAIDLWRARALLDETEELRRARENSLKELIGDHAGIEGEGWRATWKKARDGTKTDWEAVARGLLTELQLTQESLLAADCVTSDPVDAMESLISKHSNSTPGSRRFLFKWAGDD